MSKIIHAKNISKIILIIFAILVGFWLFIFLFSIIAIRVFKVDEKTFVILWIILRNAIIIGALLVGIILASKKKKSKKN